MFRGEPLALSTILTGLLFFLVTITLGLFMPGSIFQSTNPGIYTSHYIAAFFGWIGLVILGAQLQFFRAIAGLRKFNPSILRYPYYITLVSGVSLLILGNIERNKVFMWLGMSFFSVGVIIHTIWLLPQMRNSLFKFPLNYLLGSHLFLLLGLILSWDQLIDNPFLLARNFSVIHVLGIGWISLNLQGALIRALPMFVGQVIDRQLRAYIDYHFIFSFLASFGLAIFLTLTNTVLIWIFGALWFVSWIWVIVLLIKSIFTSKREIDKKYTLLYFFPGILFMAFGAMIGYHTATAGQIMPRAVHIHLTLLAGLSLIMLGAINRITSFQMYTLVYTGRKEEGVRIDDFLNEKIMLVLAPGFILSVSLIILYFADLVDLIFFQIGIIVFFIHVIGYFLQIGKNVIHFIKEYPNAIPYDKKPSEV